MKRKDNKPNRQKPKNSNEASREPRGAFVFTDRTGKPHAIAGGDRGGLVKPRGAAGEDGAEDASEPKSRGPHRGPGARPNPNASPGGKPGPRPMPGYGSKREERGPRAPNFGHREEATPSFGKRKGSVKQRGFGKKQEREAAGPKISPIQSRGPRRDDHSARGDRGPKNFREERGGRGRSEGGRDKFQGGGRGGNFKGGKPGGKGRFGGKGGREGRRESRPFDGPVGESTKLKAIIDKNRKGFAFLQFENKEFEDGFLPPHEAERFFHGDRVEASVSDRGEVYEIRVIAHRFRELVGRFFPVGREGMVVYERKRAREEIPVSGDKKGAKSRDWVRAKMVYPEAEKDSGRGSDEFEEIAAKTRIECVIQEVYGQDLPASADIQMVSAEFNLTEEHSPEAIAEAESFKLDLNDPNRVDLRHVPFITIDGETARDFDDAVYVERTTSGGFYLWVAIADVSHYVKKGTHLDDDAYARGTSVYFPERAFHMLPRALSENLCSLRPNEPRLTMTSKIEFDRQGKKIGVEVMNSLIDSRRRATYTEIQAESEKSESDPKWEYAAHFQLYRLLRKIRNDRGSIDFDLPEAELRVEPNGEPISIKNRPRLDAHRLIEEFMIAANESVTEWALDRKWPFLYRVHDEPSRGALVKFQELCAHYGVDFPLPKDGAKGGLPEALNAVVRQVEGHPAQTVINTALLRSMAQAHYSSVYGEHFGLASRAYTHFTSPIRRYPDLVVHRMLKLALDFEREKKALSEPEREDLEKMLAEVSEHCSYRERIASEAERESIKLKQVRIMLKEVGNEFDGKIMGMNDAGLYVGINDPFVEGFVSQDSMTDDFYAFNEQRQAFIGKRKKKTYKIGDPVKVRVDKVDIDLRRVDFSLLEFAAPKDAKVESADFESEEDDE